MKKTVISVVTAVMLLPFISGLKSFERETKSFCLFPELTFSSAVDFENEGGNNDRVEVVEKKEKVEIKFKVVEWLMSAFLDT